MHWPNGPPQHRGHLRVTWLISFNHVHVWLDRQLHVSGPWVRVPDDLDREVGHAYQSCGRGIEYLDWLYKATPPTGKCQVSATVTMGINSPSSGPPASHVIAKYQHLIREDLQDHYSHVFSGEKYRLGSVKVCITPVLSNVDASANCKDKYYAELA